jgi:hypothetical protein
MIPNGTALVSLTNKAFNDPFHEFDHSSTRHLPHSTTDAPFRCPNQNERAGVCLDSPAGANGNESQYSIGPNHPGGSQNTALRR